MKRVLWQAVLVLWVGLFLTLGVLGSDVEKASPYIAEGVVFVAAPEGVPCQVGLKKERLTSAVAPNSTLYFPIEQALRAEDISNVRALTGDLSRGGEMVGAPRIEYRMLYDETGQKALGYRYVAVMPILELPGVSEAVVSGKIAVGRNWTGSEKVRFWFTVKQEGQTVALDSYLCESRSLQIEFNKNAGQVALLFGAVGRFEVDASGQGLMEVGFTQAPFTDIVAAYPNAKLRFVVWEEEPVFARTGTLILYMQPTEEVYEITSTGLISLEGAYSLEEEGYVVQTRRLGHYVISSDPLDDPLEAVAIENPPTGLTPKDDFCRMVVRD